MEETLTVLTCLILVITEGTVESCKLTKLISLELILPFRDGGGLVFVSHQTTQYSAFEANRFNDVVDQLLRFVDLLFRICHDQTMQILFLVARMSCVRSTFSFLDGSFAANCDLREGLCLHLLQCIATRPDE